MVSHTTYETPQDAYNVSKDQYFSSDLIRFCRIKALSGNMLFLSCCLLMSLIRNAFKRLHYSIDVIAQCVRWYLAYALSLCNLEEMIAERGIAVDHSTLHRWVIRLVPPLDKTPDGINVRWGVDGEWMKPTLKSEGNVNISTARWMLQAKLSTSCWPLNGILQRRCASFAKPFAITANPRW